MSQSRVCGIPYLLIGDEEYARIRGLVRRALSYIYNAKQNSHAYFTLLPQNWK